MKQRPIPRIDPVTSSNTQIIPSSSQNLYISYEYNQNTGVVTWILGNGTPQTQYLGIMRGAILGNTYVPPYYFGSAFWPDYLGTINGQRVSSVITNLTNIQPYSLASINNRFIGFVFAVPPFSEIHVQEGGFNNLVSLTYQLVTLTPTGLNSYLVFWNPLQWWLYSQQTNYNVMPVPNPYAVSMYNFNANIKVTPAFQVLMLNTNERIARTIGNIEALVRSFFASLIFTTS